MSRAIPESQSPSQAFLDFLASFDEPQHQPALAHSSYSAQPSIPDHHHAHQQTQPTMPHDHSYQIFHQRPPPYSNSGLTTGGISTFYDADLEPPPEPQDHQGWKDFGASLDRVQQQSTGAYPSITAHDHAPQMQPMTRHSQFRSLPGLPHTFNPPSPYSNSAFSDLDWGAHPETLGDQKWTNFLESFAGLQRPAVNYLQGYLAGSLMPWFSWSLSQSGPDHLKIHHATALFDGSEIGHGEGVSVDAAQTLAALRALNYLQDNPQPVPPPHPQKGRVYDRKERMIDWERIFNFPV
ncbi:hypothetical protein F5148DRAFT_860959 [Russula earlei]|uniref:Uncharacterized protein n=1 Tax=Russula earlei TaxID=71964 RepID=A0ACC0UAF9_9AGAM|nr:hypothetical protein F5148DRAFT_860959 [Russula earlei]